MATRKITSNELRSIVKRIIKENNEFRDMDDSDVAAEENSQIIDVYEEQLSKLFNFDTIENAYGEFDYTIKKELSGLYKAVNGKFLEKDRPYLMSALTSKFQYLPSTDDFPKEKYIKYIVNQSIKK
jgi:vesicle coat complex subunit